MENEGDKILGAWRFETMGASMKLQFSKAEENKYGGSLLEAEVPERLQPLLARKLKGTKRNRLEDTYNRDIFSLTFNPVKKIYELGEVNHSFLDGGTIPLMYQGLKTGFEAEVISSNTLVFRTKVFGFNRRIVLTRENE